MSKAVALWAVRSSRERPESWQVLQVKWLKGFDWCLMVKFNLTASVGWDPEEKTIVRIEKQECDRIDFTCV